VPCPIVAVLCTMAAGPGVQALPAAAPAPPPVVRKINKMRRRKGVPRLRVSRALSRTSRRFAHDLMAADRLAHAPRIKAPRRFRRVGEVLAMQPGWRRSPSTAARAWLNSPGHRRVILARSFDVMGVAAARGRFGGRRATIWVAQLGRR